MSAPTFMHRFEGGQGGERHRSSFCTEPGGDENDLLPLWPRGRP
jgi:hypothetical protein